MKAEVTYYCFGVFSTKSSGDQVRKIIGECLLIANFLNPRLKLSKNEINFCLKVAPDDPFPPSPTGL